MVQRPILPLGRSPRKRFRAGGLLVVGQRSGQMASTKMGVLDGEEIAVSFKKYFSLSGEILAGAFISVEPTVYPVAPRVVGWALSAPEPGCRRVSIGSIRGKRTPLRRIGTQPYFGHSGVMGNQRFHPERRDGTVSNCAWGCSSFILVQHSGSGQLLEVAHAIDLVSLLLRP